MVQPSRRSAAAKKNGRLGGLQTAKKSQEFLEERASKAGTETRDRYGLAYYRHIRNNQDRSSVISSKERLAQVIREILPSANESTTKIQLMQAAAAKA